MVSAERFEDYFQLTDSLLLDDKQWERVAERPDGSSMSHCSHQTCDGSRRRLLKIDARHVFVQNAAQLSAADLLVLPEVRSTIENRACELSSKMIEIYGPGDVLMEQSWTLAVHMRVAIFFGQLSGPRKCRCMHVKDWTQGRQQLRKHFPQRGDCTTVYQDEADEYLVMCRNEEEPGRFRVVVVFGVPWEPWTQFRHQFFSELLDAGCEAVGRYFNRPGIEEMRAASVDRYQILSLRNFNRGVPLLPAEAGCAGCVRVTTGATMSAWQEFRSGTAGKFRLDEYLQQFLPKLGLRLTTFDTFGGRKLVPYQCAVLRCEWKEVRGAFMEALKIQKAAYRRLHGGTTAPSLVEDAAARFVSDMKWQDFSEPLWCKMVVRKTFLELDEAQVNCGHGMKRIKSEPHWMDLVSVTV